LLHYEFQIYNFTLKRGENDKILLVQVIASRFVQKQFHLAGGIASLRFTPLAMTIAEQ